MTTTHEIGPPLTGRSNDIQLNANQIDLGGPNTDRVNYGGSQGLNTQPNEQMYNSVRVDNFLGLLDNALDLIQTDGLESSMNTPYKRSSKLTSILQQDEEEQNMSTQQSIQQGITALRESMSSPKSMSETLKKLITQSEENKAEIDNQKMVIKDLMDQVSQKALEVIDQKRQVEETQQQIAQVKLDLAICRTEKIQLEDELEQCR